MIANLTIRDKVLIPLVIRACKLKWESKSIVGKDVHYRIIQNELCQLSKNFKPRNKFLFNLSLFNAGS